jgi:hypothetical protein
MNKRPSLAESMRQAVSEPEPPPRTTVEPQPLTSAVAARPELVTEIRPEPERRAGFYAATREGKKKLTVTVSPSDHKRFKYLSLEIDKGGERMLLEAISDYFVKHGKPPIVKLNEADHAQS